MLNAERASLMAQSMRYEQGNEKEDLKLKTYFDSGKGMLKLKGALHGAALYILIAAVVIAAAGFDIFDFTDRPLSSALIIALIIAAGVAFTLVWSRNYIRTARKRYRDIRSSLTGYDLLKKKLKQQTHDVKSETGSGK